MIIVQVQTNQQLIKTRSKYNIIIATDKKLQDLFLTIHNYLDVMYLGNIKQVLELRN